MNVIPLHLDLTVSDVVRRLSRRDRVTAWSGDWAGGGAIVTCDPIRTATTIEALDDVPSVTSDHPGAVGGGWFGYIGYPGAPTSFAFYEWVLRHRDGQWHFESLSGDHTKLAELLHELEQPYAPEPARLTIRRTPDRTEHLIAVEKAIHAIRKGDIYQANICTALELTLTGSPYDAWCRLVEELRPARAAIVGDVAISASPELLLRRKGNAVCTAPIKGTRPRTQEDDEASILRQSSKDAAENVMIVDLMRNDLSRVCEVGSVTVPKLLTVEPHPGVWHLVSYVQGTLAEDIPNSALVRAAFPPGSVTGAPKLRAQQIIDELESAPRGIYTGALGFASPVAGLELSVAIRTFEVHGHEARLGVGGGITVDSTPVEEWQECQIKVAPLLATLGASWTDAEPLSRLANPALGVFETVLIVNGHVMELADHVSRLRRSYWECYRIPLTANVIGRAEGFARTTTGCWRARIVARPTTPGDVDIEPEPCDPPYPLSKQAGLMPRMTQTSNLERHKYVDRSWLTDDALYVDDDQVLETDRANVFAVIDGVVTTPPLDGRILPGVTRQVILDLAGDLGIPINIALITIADLDDATGVFVTNAIRGVQWVRTIGEHSWPQPDPITQQLSDRLLERWSS